MSPLLVRLGVLVLITLLLSLLVWMGRRFVEMRRRQALGAEPLVPGMLQDAENAIDGIVEVSKTGTDKAGSDTNKETAVRILAFSSDDCHQCHRLQAPALQRVREEMGERVTVIEVDAPASPELTQRYHILTVPSTVILDAKGHVHAVNYGFASTQRLLQQIDTVLAMTV
jgi:thioredoxin-like negative regulator of GroEL